jgi:hypothetical protein
MKIFSADWWLKWCGISIRKNKQIYPCSKQERKTVIRPSKRKAKGGGWV